MPAPAPKAMDKFVALARYIADNADASLPLATLAERVQLSPSRLQRVFKSIFTISPKQLQQAARSEKFKALLRSGSDITSAIYQAGYGSSSRVYEKAQHNIGMTPKAYRGGALGEAITYACRDTVLGPMLMAATDRGVCFAQFGENCEALLAQLRAEFPRAELLAFDGSGAQQLDLWIQSMNAYLQQQQPRPELPLDLKGTAFQIKVWQFLLSTSEGEVASYGELARAIEKPRAVRAAASACAANRVAVLVPCHRVLRGDGGLGGYRWGVERKRALLDLERAQKAAAAG